MNNIYSTIDLDVPYYSINQTSIQIMLNSGARGTLSQIKQIISSRGYMTGFNGKLCEMPVLNSYFDGLNFIHFFCCTYSSRRGLIDTVLKTSVSGYLTRKLVEISRECIVSEEDCNVTTGLCIRVVLSFGFIKNRLIGRFLAKPIIYNNRIIVESNTLITEYNICNILGYCDGFVYIRSPVMCQAKTSICRFCYGIDLNLSTSVRLGDPIGILAAQAMDEPGTQLTLRTFHGLSHVANDRNGNGKLGDILQAPCSGVLVLTNLSCVRTSFGIMVVNTSGVFSILNNGIVIWKKRIRRGVCLLVSNNTCVSIGEILCFNYSLNDYCLSLIGGIVFIKDLVYNLNLQSALNSQMKFIRCNIDRISDIPSIYLKVGFINLCCLVNKDSGLLVLAGTKVSVFDVLLTSLVRKQDITQLSYFEGFSKLSKLFESGSKDGYSITSCVRGVLRYGNLNNNSNIYVIDPVSVLVKPIVYSLHNRKCLLGNNEELCCGQIIVSGNTRVLNCVDICEFNELFNCFIDMALEIYDLQGVDINSKHIEVVLRQMTNIITIVDEGNTSFVCDEEYKFQDVVLANYYIGFVNGKLALFSREIEGITGLCANQTSILSSISFHGSVKLVIKAILIGGIHALKGIKDNIILGNLPPVGTGFNRSF